MRGDTIIFYDHHGLYDETIHVPLILKHPSLESGNQVSGFVQHTDLFPTILDILGINKEGPDFDGKSLLPLIQGDIPQLRSWIYAEENNVEKKKMIRTDKYKFIYAPSKEAATCRMCGKIHGGVEELYNLENDPYETENILEEEEEKAKELKSKLFDFLDKLERKKMEKKKIKGKIEKLKNLGKI